MPAFAQETTGKPVTIRSITLQREGQAPEEVLVEPESGTAGATTADSLRQIPAETTPTVNNRAMPSANSGESDEAATLAGDELRLLDDFAEIVETLYRKYDPDVTPEIRARAQAYVNEREIGITPGKAWNDFAVGQHMIGVSPVAAWACLGAVRVEWRGEFVANCGAILIEAGRFRAGLAFLRRAFDLGHRSAYLHEAMAAAHEALGDKRAAEREIETAAQLDPYDTAIRVQRALLVTGEPPASPKKPEPDDLDRAYAELLAQVDYVTRETKSLAQALDRWEARAGFPPDQVRAQWVAGHVDSASEGLRSAVETAIERARSREPPFSDYPLYWRNHALLTMVDAYASTTITLLASLDDLNAEWAFWAPVAWRGKEQYAHWLHNNMRYLFSYDVSSDPPANTYPASFISSVKGSSLDHWLMISPRIAAYHDKVYGPDEQVPCNLWARELSALEGIVEARLRIAAPRFDVALNGVLKWNRLAVMDARRYANKWLAKLHKRDKTSQDSVLVTLLDNETRFIETIKSKYSQLIPFQPRFFIDQRAQDFAMGRRFLLEKLEYERQSLNRCKPPRKRKFADYSKAELEELLAELDALMKEDVEAEYEIKPECKASVDGFSASFDSRGGVELGAGGMAINQSGEASTGLGPLGISREGATGVAVEVGHSISGGEGLVGSASIKVTGKLDSATGEWDAVAELGGKLGVGVAVPAVGEAACYPGAGKVTLNARSFLRKEVMYQRVAEELARR